MPRPAQLGADAFEQLGLSAPKSATWRNAYLLGAQELRQGPPAARPSGLDPEMVQAMPVTSVVFDVLGTHVNAPAGLGARGGGELDVDRHA